MPHMNPLDTLRAALKDPHIRIDVISAPHAEEIARLVGELSPDEYVSEWRHNLWAVRYEYHRHESSVALALKQLYDSGVYGGNPKLIRIYSRSDLERIIQPQMVPNS